MIFKNLIVCVCLSSVHFFKNSRIPSSQFAMAHSYQKLSGFERFMSLRTTMLVSSVWLPLSRFLFIALMRTLLTFLLFAPVISHSCLMFFSLSLLNSTNSFHTFCNFAENREILIHGKARYLRHTMCIYLKKRQKTTRSKNSIKFHAFVFTLYII